MESEFFDTRQAFLSLCPGSTHQFDSLRQREAHHDDGAVPPEQPIGARVRGHLQRVPARAQAGQGAGAARRAPTLTCARRVQEHSRPRAPAARGGEPAAPAIAAQAWTEEDRRDRAAQIQHTMELLVHATTCRAQNCGSPNCTKVKHLFRHATSCQVKAGGGCQLCRKMWTLLQVAQQGVHGDGLPGAPLPRHQGVPPQGAGPGGGEAARAVQGVHGGAGGAACRDARGANRARRRRARRAPPTRRVPKKKKSSRNDARRGMTTHYFLARGVGMATEDGRASRAS